MTEHSEFLSLLRLLRQKLKPEELETLELEASPLPPEAYDPAMERILRRVRAIEDQVSRNEERVELRYRTLVDQPPGQQTLLLKNSPPQLLAALVQDLIRQSYADRLGPVDRSLRLASLAVEAASLIAKGDYFSPQTVADVQAEAWAYLANARRINSDTEGAEEALRQASVFFRSGTERRDLKADIMALRAALRSQQGYPEEAAGLFEREIALRRLLGDEEKLGIALISRGIVAIWFQPLGDAVDSLEEGLSHTTDVVAMILALCAMAEALAREGDGWLAWKALCRAETACLLAGETRLDLRLKWISGLVSRVAGKPEVAARELEAVQSTFNSMGLNLAASFVSIDLAATYAELGDMAGVRRLAEEAYAVFRRERLAKRALGAVLVLRRALESEQATASLVAEVANFLARHQYNKKLRFAPASE